MKDLREDWTINDVQPVGDEEVRHHTVAYE